MTPAQDVLASAEVLVKNIVKNYGERDMTPEPICSPESTTTPPPKTIQPCPAQATSPASALT
jgi:hypothetical protein